MPKMTRTRPMTEATLAYISIYISRQSKEMSTKASTMVQSSQRADLVRNRRVNIRSTTKMAVIISLPTIIPTIVPVLFWFPSGGTFSWELILIVLRSYQWDSLHVSMASCCWWEVLREVSWAARIPGCVIFPLEKSWRSMQYNEYYLY